MREEIDGDFAFDVLYDCVQSLSALQLTIIKDVVDNRLLELQIVEEFR